MLRFGYNTNGFSHHGLLDTLEILAECGYDGVAITLNRHHLCPERSAPAERKRLRDRLRELRLHPVVETTGWFTLDPWSQDEPSLVSPNNQNRRLRYTQQAIDTAAEIGSDTVTVVSGELAAGSSPDAAFDRLADGCRHLSDYAEMHGVTVALQPKTGMFIERLNQFALLHKAVDHQNFRLAFDLGTVAHAERCTPSRALERFADRVATIQISDTKPRTRRILPLGEGTVPIKAFLRTVEQIAYPGLLTATFEHYANVAPTIAQQSIRYLRNAAPKPMELLAAAEADQFQF